MFWEIVGALVFVACLPAMIVAGFYLVCIVIAAPFAMAWGVLLMVWGLLLRVWDGLRLLLKAWRLTVAWWQRT